MLSAGPIILSSDGTGGHQASLGQSYICNQDLVPTAPSAPPPALSNPRNIKGSDCFIIGGRDLGAQLTEIVADVARLRSRVEGTNCLTDNGDIIRGLVESHITEVLGLAKQDIGGGQLGLRLADMETRMGRAEETMAISTQRPEDVSKMLEEHRDDRHRVFGELGMKISQLEEKSEAISREQLSSQISTMETGFCKRLDDEQNARSIAVTALERSMDALRPACDRAMREAQISCGRFLELDRVTRSLKGDVSTISNIVGTLKSDLTGRLLELEQASRVNTSSLASIKSDILQMSEMLSKGLECSSGIEARATEVCGRVVERLDQVVQEFDVIKKDSQAALYAQMGEASELKQSFAADMSVVKDAVRKLQFGLNNHSHELQFSQLTTAPYPNAEVKPKQGANVVVVPAQASPCASTVSPGTSVGGGGTSLAASLTSSASTTDAPLPISSNLVTSGTSSASTTDAPVQSLGCPSMAPLPILSPAAQPAGTGARAARMLAATTS